MNPAMQMKLLRVLQEREFERVGDSHTIKIDVRVIAATNSDLRRMVAEGTFREDLFYRLNVIPIRAAAAARPARGHSAARAALPPAVRPAGRRRRAPAVTVSQDAHAPLMAYHWPGNVRQLENIIERALALSPGRTQIEVVDLPRRNPERRRLDGDAGADASRRRDSTSRSTSRASSATLIQQSLERTQGNKRQAAKLLNLKRTTLIEKLKRLEGLISGPTSPDYLPRSDATTSRLLDDRDRCAPDGLSCARARGAAAHVPTAAVEAARRPHEMVRTRALLGVARRGPSCRQGSP